MMVYQIPISRIHVFNITAQLLFDYVLVKYAGVNALVYLLLSSFLAGSLHPLAGHFIAEHYVFGYKQTKQEEKLAVDAPVPETFSYYGPLNFFAYNVGYHNEHHDFPAIPWTRLPSLHTMAKEFYKDLPYHESWPLVLWQFILDPEVGLWCRVKREQGGRKVGSWRDDEVN